MRQPSVFFIPRSAFRLPRSLAVTPMELQSSDPTVNTREWKQRIVAFFSPIPLLGWLLGSLAAVGLEHAMGEELAEAVGFSGIPMLFGINIILKQPVLIPSTLLYVLVIYALPICLVARFTSSVANPLAERLLKVSAPLSGLIHLGLLYAVLHLWTDISDYRLITLRLILIAVMVTLSLNVVNGYMGEFSCSHPGFMAMGAYGTSVFTLILFVDNNKLTGSALLPPSLGPFLFPLGLVIGGLVAALSALIVAIPSFKTRGDYLAVISLAFTFIVKSLIENLEIVGGARGLSGEPAYADLPTVFFWTVLCVWIINNFVRSTLGKALNAVRDDETAASAMTVNTRHTKIVAFLFAAFWAGVAGGLFAHVLRYVNPGTFGLQALADVLAMLYLGGLNSVYGSVVGAVGLSLLSEALRPLEIYKWIIIPALVIVVMVFRPSGLIAFREFDVKSLLRPRRKAG
jgi:branched-chain amino acid transport system permease protein